MTATKEAGAKGQPKKLVDANDYIETDFAIHHCGMAAHMRALGLGGSQVTEQAVMHSGLVVTALMTGGAIPVHATPGIQLLAVAMAQTTVRQGAERLAGDFGLSLDALGRHAAAAHVSHC